MRSARLHFRRLALGIASGALISVFIRLLLTDSKFLPYLRSRFANAEFQSHFEGAGKYRFELLTLVVAVCLIFFIPLTSISLRFLRSWWAGITSLVTPCTAVLTIVILQTGLNSNLALVCALAVGTLTIGESLRSTAPPKRSDEWKLHIAGRKKQPLETFGSSDDDPIKSWEQDIIGRASIVELLAEHAITLQTPIVALHGGLGDGKTSVLNLLRRTIEKDAVVVSFSAWLPGSESTFATDLFSDIASECRKSFYVPELRKHALAYARMVSSSVSLLSGLQSLLPQPSQKDELDDLRSSLARIPAPIVVLMDEIDRMERDELLVLLKILRGASSIPNVTFICAFNDSYMRHELSHSRDVSYEYLEKFFPVSVNLSAPGSDILGRLFIRTLEADFKEAEWYRSPEAEKKSTELLERIWNDSLARICTNFRKLRLLLNDIRTNSRPIAGEVNPVDFVVIESLRRFYPEIYLQIRTNPGYLTQGGSKWDGRYLSQDQRKKGLESFVASLNKLVESSNEPGAVKEMLSWCFPAYHATNSGGLSIYSLGRPTTEETSEIEQRVCHADYFPIYFRGAVSEDIFSNSELRDFLSSVKQQSSEQAVVDLFQLKLDEIPRNHSKRVDFLWKLGRSLNDSDETTAERLAHAAALCADQYSYDVINIGESARALNIIFNAAQKFSRTSRAQSVLLKAMDVCPEDTFAFRLWTYTKEHERNKVLTDFSNIDVSGVNTAFIERMRRRYSTEDGHPRIDIQQADWHAFHFWVDNSPRDKDIEQDFWRWFIGGSLRRLGDAINFIYPGGGNLVWSEDPSPLVDKLLPMEEIQKLILALPPEDLLPQQSDAIKRFERLLKGRFPKPGSFSDDDDDLPQASNLATDGG